MQPASPISSHTASSSRSPSTPIYYRLAAVVCHYGTHSFGHYVTFRRKPRTSHASHPAHLGHPRLAHPIDCVCPACIMVGRIRDYEPHPDTAKPVPPNKGWLRISDATVEEVGLTTVLRETSGTFMLYYERVIIDNQTNEGRRQRRNSSLSRKVPPPLQLDPVAEAKMQPYIHVSNPSASSSTINLPIHGGIASPRSSEETVTPENVRLSTPGSPRHRAADAEEDQPDTPKASASQELPPLDKAAESSSSTDFFTPFPTLPRSASTTSARIIRNVSVGRSRTSSAASSVILPNPPTSRPPPLIIESDPSTLPPGSSRTKTKFTPPITPLESGGARKRTKSKKTANGGPQAPARTPVGVLG